MYLGLEAKPRDKAALVDDFGSIVSFGELCSFMSEMKGFVKSGAVVFCLCENSVGAIAGYLSFMENGAVPLLLNARIDRTQLANLMQTYTPPYICFPDRYKGEFSGCRVIFGRYGYVLAETGNKFYPVNKDLAMLLCTSGSTGSPKLVRHKLINLEMSAKHVSEFFGACEDDRSMADLPMYYTMGLSVINSYLYRGATVAATSKSLMSPEFWDFFGAQDITVFTGVPYSFEILRRLRFTGKEWPHLKILTQGGGKLKEKIYLEFAEYARRTGKKFIATYGQTECSARMAYLPPEFAISKQGSIGRAIPGGELFIINDKKDFIEGPGEGEMCYCGPNVTMGYAECRKDLLKGDEWYGFRHTGDIARRDEDGFYFITGRKSRFLKLFGVRVGLDDCEKIIYSKFGIDCACAGDDKEMRVYITRDDLSDAVVSLLSDTTGILRTAFKIFVIDQLPRSGAGKILYSQLPQ
ncbi:O-succinylbenzoate--CoA ligase [Synergistes jonesii]|uniref:O-succinylbenzoate--CoA ligase n=2 Tax=Synergistes jonesii TaxID=2754 RepID=A0A073IRH0_9BACT|nr:O-succinylbenzoate--CoA ligase [Synergistes jonesii]OFB62595.1 O-succinylbenzoate--CoA ligase [Synergistes jonesii]OFB63257.1 O-succinylbenzoate--CoA ligase [Synergistes jonesii]OFB64831.1 O-succinylbenzoate--CoA ligase [Synergistes jonesii]OFB67593.1 O-succinylbenzoate--CoA ligase [Synergistes jonesii]